VPHFSRFPIPDRPTADLVLGIAWCLAVALLAFVWLGGWVLEAGVSPAGALLLAVWLLFVGVPVGGIVIMTRELRRRRRRRVQDA
jgi:hypothetical protein